MTSTVEEKAFLRAAVSALPRVTEIILGFPPDDRAGALETAERRFVMAALDYDGPLFDLFNLGESETIQLKDLIAAIEKTLGKKAKINQLPEQPGDVPLTCADISKARKLLNYNPTTPFSVGLPKFVEWFLATRSGT